MVKIIQRVFLVLVIVLGIAVGFQWKNYQEKIEFRDDALLYFEEKDYQKTISYLEEGLKNITIFGKDIDEDMTCYLAESHFQLGQYEEAIGIYQSLIKKNPSDKKYYFLMAETYQSMEDREKEISYYKKGWENTEDPDFLTKICDTYVEIENYKEALVYAKKGIELKGDRSADFLFKMIVIYEKWNDYDSAYKTAMEYCEQYPEDEKGQKELKFLTTRIS